jgi:hypothetical protein
MKTKYFLILSLIVLTMGSCDSFLVEDTRGRFDETFLLTEGGAKSFSTSMYATAHELILEQIWLFGSGGTDELTFGSGGSAETITIYDNTSTNKLSIHKSTQRAWLADYTMINNSNYGLSIADNITFSSSEAKNQFTGECRFFRAWVYWMVVETWGEGAHYTETPTQGTKSAGVKASIDKFYKLIISDCNDAIAKLNTKPSKTGQLTSGAAKALKARVLMSLAGYNESVIAATGLYSNVNGVYSDAKSIADELTATSNIYNYKLQTDYTKVFDVNNQNNSEVIWALQMTQDLDYKYSTNVMSKQHTADPTFVLLSSSSVKKLSTTGANGVYQHSAWYGRFQGDMMPTYYYSTLFDTNDKRADGTFETAYQRLYLTDGTQSDMGKPFKSGIMGGIPSDTIVYKPLRDVNSTEIAAWLKRGINCFGLNFVYDKSLPGSPPFGIRGSNARKAFPAITKFLDKNRQAPKQEYGGKEIILFRLAEMHLIGAECAYKLSGGAAAVPYIDNLRARARRIPGSLAVVASNINMTYLLDERTRELGGECLRWFDIKRTGAWNRIKTLNPDCTDFNEAYCKVRPVPVAELKAVTNPDEFTQNPGWN